MRQFLPLLLDKISQRDEKRTRTAGREIDADP